MHKLSSFALCVFLLLLLTACGNFASPTPKPTASSPPITPTVTPVTPTATPIPPTSTPTMLPPMPTKPPQPTPTPEFPPIPRGMGALILFNKYAQELGFDIGGKFYRVAPNDKLVIFLPPGRYNFSATIPGYAGANGTIEIEEGFYIGQNWGS